MFFVVVLFCKIRIRKLVRFTVVSHKTRSEVSRDPKPSEQLNEQKNKMLEQKLNDYLSRYGVQRVLNVYESLDFLGFHSLYSGRLSSCH